MNFLTKSVLWVSALTRGLSLPENLLDSSNPAVINPGRVDVKYVENDNITNTTLPFPGGETYVADTYNHRILAISANGEKIRLVAGNGTPGYTNGPAYGAQFDYPRDVTFHAEKKMLYVADEHNHRIRGIDLTFSPPLVINVAGNGARGHLDSPEARWSQFAYPSGVAVWRNMIIVADTWNNRIRSINLDFQEHPVSTIAGTGKDGSQDGPASVATFHYPAGVAVSTEGTIYVADALNHCVRRIGHAYGNFHHWTHVITIAGEPGNRGFKTSQLTASRAQFDFPTSLVVDRFNRVFVGDYHNHRVRVLTPLQAEIWALAGHPPSYEEATIAGNGQRGHKNEATIRGLGSVAKVGNPAQLYKSKDGVMVHNMYGSFQSLHFEAEHKCICPYGIPPTGAECPRDGALMCKENKIVRIPLHGKFCQPHRGLIVNEMGRCACNGLQGYIAAGIHADGSTRCSCDITRGFTTADIYSINGQACGCDGTRGFVQKITTNKGKECICDKKKGFRAILTQEATVECQYDLWTFAKENFTEGHKNLLLFGGPTFLAIFVLFLTHCIKCLNLFGWGKKFVQFSFQKNRDAAIFLYTIFRSIPIGICSFLKAIKSFGRNVFTSPRTAFGQIAIVPKCIYGFIIQYLALAALGGLFLIAFQKNCALFVFGKCKQYAALCGLIILFALHKYKQFLGVVFNGLVVIFFLPKHVAIAIIRAIQFTYRSLTSQCRKNYSAVRSLFAKKERPSSSSEPDFIQLECFEDGTETLRNITAAVKQLQKELANKKSSCVLSGALGEVTTMQEHLQKDGDSNKSLNGALDEVNTLKKQVKERTDALSDQLAEALAQMTALRAEYQENKTIKIHEIIDHVEKDTEWQHVTSEIQDNLVELRTEQVITEQKVKGSVQELITSIHELKSQMQKIEEDLQSEAHSTTIRFRDIDSIKETQGDDRKKVEQLSISLQRANQELAVKMEALGKQIEEIDQPRCSLSENVSDDENVVRISTTDTWNVC